MVCLPELLTEGGGQVFGLGKSAVQSILHRHDITRVLASEGGRTSRGRGSVERIHQGAKIQSKRSTLRGFGDDAASPSEGSTARFRGDEDGAKAVVEVSSKRVRL